jgi:hypothetical protein
VNKTFSDYLIFLSVEETQDPRKNQAVKIETEIEVLDQSENLEPSSETSIDAGNELKGTPDLLEQAVSQIKIRPVEIKSTKGQLTSKCPFGVFKSSKIQRKIFQDFCPSQKRVMSVFAT